MRNFIDALNTTFCLLEICIFAPLMYSLPLLYEASINILLFFFLVLHFEQKYLNFSSILLSRCDRPLSKQRYAPNETQENLRRTQQGIDFTVDSLNINGFLVDVNMQIPFFFSIFYFASAKRKQAFYIWFGSQSRAVMHIQTPEE